MTRSAGTDPATQKKLAQVVTTPIRQLRLWFSRRLIFSDVANGSSRVVVPLAQVQRQLLSAPRP